MLTAEQFRRRLRDQRIPVTYVATLDTGQFQIYLQPGIAPSMFQILLEDIEALPEVRSAQRPPTPRGADVLFITPTWLPEQAAPTQPARPVGHLVQGDPPASKTPPATGADSLRRHPVAGGRDERARGSARGG